MQAYQGYYEAGRFRTLEGNNVMEQGKAILLFIDVTNGESSKQLAAFDKFLDDVHASGEEPPEFERVNLSREIDL